MKFAELPVGVIIEIPCRTAIATKWSSRSVLWLEAMNRHHYIVQRTSASSIRRSIHCGLIRTEKPIDTKAMLRRLRYLLDGHAKEVVKILSVEDDPDQPFFRAF